MQKPIPKITFWKLTKGIRIYCLLSIFTILVEVLMQVFLPDVSKDVINALQNNTADINYVLQKGAILIALALIALLTGILGAYFSNIASTRYAQNIRNAIIKQVNEFSFEDIDHFTNGSIINRLNIDVNNVQMSFRFIIGTFIRLPIIFLLSLTMSFKLSLTLSSIFLVTLPILCSFFVLIWFISFPKFKLMYKQYDLYNQKIQENLNSIRTIKSYVTENSEYNKVASLANTLKDTNIKVNKYLTFNSLLINGIIYSSFITLAIIGTQLYLGQKIQIGTIMAFGSYIWMVSGSLMGIMNVLSQILMSIPASKRIKEILNYVPTILDAKDAIKHNVIADIEFKNVSFAYANSSHQALKNINLRIPANSSFGIIGQTGSGKTTLINLIPRFYSVKDGAILIDGININKIQKDNLRQQISVVFQDSTLFKGTIRENMLFANPDATDEQIYQALSEANIYDYVYGLEDKLDHVVEQRGRNFSGGQKQRLAIAQSLLKQPKILILDDSTSALDSKTENHVKNAVSKLKNCTKIIIAQKISSIKDCDNIILLQDGKIQIQGNHEYLLKHSKYYNELYQSQQNAGGLDEVDAII
ncbi:ABC transporter ATP-binding protein [Mycoplasma sp. 2704]|uniref:ABC transporter ATP-binding protein n=1 Tax=unclassified Mycoplasma TaxID=2683645 RepID=UPI002B1D58A0|nr:MULTISPECIES: ABC transporter ATP-binding protein [unclassified Mycoplasma]MEA4134211.1 ABC transporter ATP-binding protein [Mycoplasma sp. 2704]MEA4333563.1 ABC transporter ATP-binding protein [Mycoplasma sp. 1232]